MTTMGKNHIAGLTSLRGIAAMGIVVHHFMVMLFPDLHNAFIATLGINKLYLFVDLFFILSGFVLSHVYSERYREGFTSTDYRQFMLARFARIYPVHFFMLLVFLVFHGMYLLALATADNPATIVAYGFGEQRTLSSFVSNVFLLQAFPAMGSWNGPAWSISAEWFTYLLIPLLVLAVHRLGNVQKIFLFLFGLLVLILIEYIWGDLGLWWGGWPLVIRCMAEATMGVVLYRWYRAGLALRFSGHAVTYIFLLAGISMALPIPHVVTVLLFALLILATTQIQEHSSHWLVHRWLLYLGLISYSIYMVHALVRQMIIEPSIWFWGEKPGDLLSMTEQIGLLLIAILVTIVLSALCFRYIEMPWRVRLIHSVSIRQLLRLPPDRADSKSR